MIDRYVKPQMVVIDVEPEEMLALSLSDKQARSGNLVLSNQLRDEWIDFSDCD